MERWVESYHPAMPLTHAKAAVRNACVSEEVVGRVRVGVDGILEACHGLTFRNELSASPLQTRVLSRLELG